MLSLPHALRFLLATNPAALTQVLGVVYRTIAHYLISQAGLTRTRAATGAVTLIQRFGSALNLNIHFHVLLLGGVDLLKGAHPPQFRPVAGPSANELQRLVGQVGAHVAHVLERRGLIERDIENAWLATDFEAGRLDDLIGHSITYRIAVGPRAGQKLSTLQTVPPQLQGLELAPNDAARAGGFSLHAGVDIAPHSPLRAAVTPAQRGMGAAKPPPADPAQPPTPRHVAMSWAQRLKRVFGIEIDTCQCCGGTLRIIASIEQPEVIAKILSHLKRTAPQPNQPERPLGARAPPVQSRLR